MMDWIPGMQYVIYGLFALWTLRGLGELFVGVFRVVRPNDDIPNFKLRPTGYYVGSSIFTLAVTGLLAWLFISDRLSAWWVFMAGTIVLVPEAIYFFSSRAKMTKAQEL